MKHITITVLFAITLFFILFGCTSTKTITFDSGLNQLSQISSDYNIINNSEQNYEISTVIQYEQKLNEFKSNLATYEDTNDKTILLELTDVYLASATLLKLYTPEVKTFFEEYYATGDISTICDNKTLDVDITLSSISASTISMNEKIISFVEKYPIEAEKAELSSTNLYDVSGGEYLFSYKKENKLIEKLCFAFTDLNSEAVIFDTLVADENICSKLTELDSTKNKLVADLDSLINLTEIIISTSKEYNIGSISDLEAYSSQLEISKETITDSAKQVTNAC